jgi:hypothetical protein
VTRGQKPHGHGRCWNTGRDLDHHLHTQEETLNHTIPQPPPGRQGLPELEAMLGRDDSALEDRVMDLEEALASRKARRRLRRKLRAQTTAYAWAGPSFRAARLEAYDGEQARGERR